MGGEEENGALRRFAKRRMRVAQRARHFVEVCSEMSDTVVVIGGGLAGLAACIEAVENGAGKVPLVCKDGALGPAGTARGADRVA